LNTWSMQSIFTVSTKRQTTKPDFAAPPRTTFSSPTV
jgi:hypothetical protein